MYNQECLYVFISNNLKIEQYFRMNGKQNKAKAGSTLRTVNNCFIRCPFDHKHFVLKEKYETHLLNCAQRHPEIHLLFCPFNTSHRCVTLEALVKSLECVWKTIFLLIFISFHSRADTLTIVQANNSLEIIHQNEAFFIIWNYFHHDSLRFMVINI